MRTFLLFTLIATTGCTTTIDLVSETKGDHGNAKFTYSSCFLGCATTTPMMLGDEETISVYGTIPDGVSVTTTSSDVISVKSAQLNCCVPDADGKGSTCRLIALTDKCAAGESSGSLELTVDAPQEGSSDLLVKKSDGSVWDSVTLSVERAASLDLACTTKSAVTLAQAGTCPVTWKATNAGGKELMSTAGIHLVTSDADVAQLAGFLSPPQSEIQSVPMIFGEVTVVAGKPGDATVTATGGGVTETLAVHVTP